jgi:hypothetical protein
MLAVPRQQELYAMNGGHGDSLVWRLEHAIGAQVNPPKRFASTHRSVPLVSRALCRL